jgi:hypothetical protein
VAAGHERRGECDHGRAVHVVVHDGLGKRLLEADLYLEALRGRDVLQVYAAERRRDAHHRLYEFVHVFRVYEDGHGGDAG